MKTNNLIYLIALTILSSTLILSCGDDGPGGGNGNVDCTSSIAVNNAISDEVEAISVAVSNYTSDPSSSNCNSLKAAYQNYIDALKSLQDCANDAGVGDDFMFALVNAEGSIDGLVC